MSSINLSEVFGEETSIAIQYPVYQHGMILHGGMATWITKALNLFFDKRDSQVYN